MAEVAGIASKRAYSGNLLAHGFYGPQAYQVILSQTCYWQYSWQAYLCKQFV